MYEKDIDHSMFQSGLQEQQDNPISSISGNTVCCVVESAGVATSVVAVE